MRGVIRISLLLLASVLLFFVSCKNVNKDQKSNFAPTHTPTRVPAEGSSSISYPERSQRPEAPVIMKGNVLVRLLIARNNPSVTFQVPIGTRVKLDNLDNTSEETTLKQASTFIVTQTSKGIKVGITEHKRVTFTPTLKSPLYIKFTNNNSPVTYEFTRTVTAFMMQSGVGAAVHLGMEEYLVDVVPNEVYPTWPAEALKAQAVAARTYAMWYVMTQQKAEFDLCAVNSMAWKPSKTPNANALQAVNATQGVVMVDTNKQVFPAFFSAACGGRTLSAVDAAFTGTVYPALSGNVDCGWCMSPEEKTWTYTMNKSDISAALQSRKLISRPARSYQFLGTDKNKLSTLGRVVWVRVVLDSGTQVDIPSDLFRKAVGLGKGKMMSTYYVANGQDSSSPNITFTGKGHGHGVGMCQYGIHYYAKQGQQWPQILRKYYPTVSFTKLSSE